MPNKRGIMKESERKSVKSVGEHVQASDDQGWVHLEVEGVWMLFPTAEPREMSLSAQSFHPETYTQSQS